MTYKRDGVYVTDPVLKEGVADVTPGISRRETGTTKYAHAGLKNDSAQTVAAQTVAGTKRYDAFGLLSSSTGSWSGQFSYGGPFGYQEDTESGLKLLGHRYYDASTGRFLTRDPLQDGRNWNTYCDGNPIARIDPEGLQSKGGLDKGRGDDPFYNKSDAELKKIEDDPESTEKEKERARRIRKHKGGRNKRKRAEQQFSGPAPSISPDWVVTFPNGRRIPMKPLPYDPRHNPTRQPWNPPKRAPGDYSGAYGLLLPAVVAVVVAGAIFAPEITIPVIVTGGRVLVR